VGCWLFQACIYVLTLLFYQYIKTPSFFCVFTKNGYERDGKGGTTIVEVARAAADEGVDNAAIVVGDG
jgi:hypothetical protein